MNQELIEKALRIMMDAHEGQCDLDGRAAVLHPLTVGQLGSTDEAMVVGWLHDVVEDCPEWDFSKLESAGFGKDVTDAIRLLTHDPEVPYLEYVAQIIASGNKIAQEVKMNDLRHNLSRGMAGNHQRLVKKHSAAKELFVEAGIWQDAIV